MDIKSENKKLTDRERTFVAILAAWTVLHVILLIISDGDSKYFWPFDEQPEIKSDYDISEFAVYGLVPWFGFFVHRYLKKNK